MIRLLPVLLLACTGPETDAPIEPARVGDADAGWDYLRYGDYVGNGVPKEVWFDLIPASTYNPLQRDGESERLFYSFNLFDAPNGVEVVGGINCFGCHSGLINDTFIPGLGDAWSDFSAPARDSSLLTLAVNTRYGEDSPEAEAYLPFGRGGDAGAPAMQTAFAGPNIATGLERELAAWRDPDTMEWQAERVFAEPVTKLATDVPPWWNVKKKSRIYYTGWGGGDLSRLIAQISVLAINDADHYRQIADNMVDVVAWLEQLEAPEFPGALDATEVEAGAVVFAENCERCHGTYGEDETYPELFIELDKIGTDPLYAQTFQDEPGFMQWLQSTWMADDGGNSFVSEMGYVAPPLDGIWATAPYLHNGSVPDLATLLDSQARPAAWSKGEWGDYDVDAPGLVWTAAEVGTGEAEVYDTTVPGFSNGGHTYADALSDEDRSALIAYLKSI